MNQRNQSRAYYAVRDELHRLDPGLDVRTVSQLARAVLRDGLVRVRETVNVEIVDRDGRPFAGNDR